MKSKLLSLFIIFISILGCKTERTDIITILDDLIKTEPSNSYYLYLRSEAHAHQENYSQSLIDIDQAIIIEPDSSHYHILKAEILSSIGKHDEAIKSFKNALRNEPNQSQYLYYLAKELFYIGQNDSAQKSIEKALNLSENPNLYALRAEIFLSQNKINEAIQDLNTALDISNNIDFLYTRASAYTTNEQYELALSDLNHILEKNKSHSDALFLRALIYLNQDNYETAHLDFNALLSSKLKNNEDVILGSALANLYLGNLEVANLKLNKLIRLKPEEAYFKYLRSMTQPVICDAYDDLSKSLDIDPENVKYLYHRSTLECSQSKSTVACINAGSVIKRTAWPPSAPQFWSNEPPIEREIPRSSFRPLCSDALKDISLAIELGLNSAHAFALRGNIRKKLDDYRGAMIDYLEATQIEPHNDEYFYQLARLQERFGENISALSSYTKAMYPCRQVHLSLNKFRSLA